MRPCPLCRAVHRTTLYRATRSGDVHRCTACGFVYADPTGESAGPRLPHCKDSVEVYELNAAHRLAVLKTITGIDRGRLLDVGCFDGSFMLAAQRLGFDVEGLEPEAEPAAEARARGLSVQQSTFEDADLRGPFDVVALIHSLEHLPDPWAALERARSLLSDRGALLIETPNFACLSRRLLGRRWRQFIHDHAQFFEPDSLRRLLERTGFAPRTIRTVGKIASLRLLADRVERYYSGAAGRVLHRGFDRLGWTDRTLALNLGDIMLAVATPVPRA
jgi:2-polyprenyl-3-methyl-5-hydroxy-6-metoxy-1,4-benzoquinol methylase